MSIRQITHGFVLFAVGILTGAVPVVASAEGVDVNLSSSPGCTLDEEAPLILIGVQASGLAFEESLLELRIPPGVLSLVCNPVPTGPAPLLRWRIGPGVRSQEIACGIRVAATGAYPLTVAILYSDGGQSGERTWDFTARAVILSNQDGDLLPDCMDPYPESATPCGDMDGDGADDCTGEYDDYDECCDEGCVRQHDPRSGLCPATVGGRTRVPREISWSLLLLVLVLRRRAKP